MKGLFMIGLFLSGCVHKKRVQSGKNRFLLPVVFGSLVYLVYCHILCFFFSKLLTPSKMLNFIFIEFTWKLGYLWRLNFGQEK